MLVSSQGYPGIEEGTGGEKGDPSLEVAFALSRKEETASTGGWGSRLWGQSFHWRPTDSQLVERGMGHK